MLRVIITIALSAHAIGINLNRTLSDSGERIYLDLEEYFAELPSSYKIEVDLKKSIPYPIHEYMNITIPDIMTPIVKIKAITAEGWELRSTRILKGLSIFSQPVRVLLMEDNLMVLIMLE
jgi:hypothetical protein